MALIKRWNASGAFNILPLIIVQNKEFKEVMCLFMGFIRTQVTQDKSWVYTCTYKYKLHNIKALRSNHKSTGPNIYKRQTTWQKRMSTTYPLSAPSHWIVKAVGKITNSNSCDVPFGTLEMCTFLSSAAPDASAKQTMFATTIQNKHTSIHFCYLCACEENVHHFIIPGRKLPASLKPDSVTRLYFFLNDSSAESIWSIRSLLFADNWLL